MTRRPRAQSFGAASGSVRRAAGASVSTVGRAHGRAHDVGSSMCARATNAVASTPSGATAPRSRPSAREPRANVPSPRGFHELKSWINRTKRVGGESFSCGVHPHYRFLQQPAWWRLKTRCSHDACCREPLSELLFHGARIFAQQGSSRKTLSQRPDDA